MAREGVTLKCSICNEHNYITKVNKKTQAEKLQTNKFCARCNKQTEHIQIKPKK